MIASAPDLYYRTGGFHSDKSESRATGTTSGRARRASGPAVVVNMLRSGIRYCGVVAIAQVAGFFVSRGKPIP